MRLIPRCALLLIFFISLTATLFAAAPTISSLSVTSGIVGTSVTINGSNFGNSQGSSTVTFNGVIATPTSWNKTRIVTTVPTDATTGLVKVTVSGTASNGVNFSVIPHITSLSPSSGHTSDVLTISGSGFGPVRNASTVTFGSAGATVNSWTSRSIIVVIPQQAGSSVVVTVSGTASNSTQFTLLPGPSITALSLTSGPVGTSLTVAGANFGGTPGSITFNGTAATPTSWSDSSIGVAVPALATTGNVVVTAYGTHSNGVPFTVTPYIATLSPMSGSVGTVVAITGTSFGATQGSSTISFNGTPAAPTSWGDTGITAPVPTGATTGNVVVTVDGIQSNSMGFSVSSSAMNISTLSPVSSRPNSEVLISGSGFGDTEDNGTVTFNGVNSQILFWTDTDILVVAPANATTGNVVVHKGDDSNGMNFTVLIPTLVSLEVSPGISSLSAGESVQFSAIGTYNDGNTEDLTNTVTWNSTASGIVSVDGTGSAKAIANGSATLTASLVAISGTVNLNVAPRPLDAIITTTGYSLPSGAGINGSLQNQKPIAVGQDGFARFFVIDTYVRCLDEDCINVHTKTFQQAANNSTVALGPDGFARIAYSGAGFLGFIQCFDDDCDSFSSNEQVDWTTNNFAAITVAPDGTSYILYAYFDEDAFVNQREYFQGVALATCNTGGCSTSRITHTSTYVDTYGAITYDASGGPAGTIIEYSYVPSQSGTVYYYSNGSHSAVSSEPYPYMPDISLGPDGLTRLAFLNNLRGVTFLRCLDSGCASNASQHLSFPDPYVYAVSLVTGSNGNATITSATNAEGGSPPHLNYVRCFVGDCSENSNEQISGDWSSGTPVSIASATNQNSGVATPSAVTSPCGTISGDNIRLIAIGFENRVKQIRKRAPMTLCIRSFAPWDYFAISYPLFAFQGDNRSFTTSTDPSVTSRMSAMVQFNPATLDIDVAKDKSVPTPFAWSDESVLWYLDVGSGLLSKVESTGHPTLVVQNGLQFLYAHLAGANPLTGVITPDIDTKVDLTVVQGSNQVCYSGRLYGDGFPNSEVFLIDESGNATMLVTFTTAGSQQFGALRMLWGNGSMDMRTIPSTCFPYHP